MENHKNLPNIFSLEEIPIFIMRLLLLSVMMTFICVFIAETQESDRHTDLQVDRVLQHRHSDGRWTSPAWPSYVNYFFGSENKGTSFKLVSPSSSKFPCLSRNVFWNSVFICWAKLLKRVVFPSCSQAKWSLCTSGTFISEPSLTRSWLF